MSTYHVWITSELPLNEAKFISNLITAGYTVESADGSESIVLKTTDAHGYGVIGLKLSKENATLAKEVYNDVCHCLGIIKLDYYSIVVSEYHQNAVWNHGTVSKAKSMDTKTQSKLN